MRSKTQKRANKLNSTKSALPNSISYKAPKVKMAF